MTSSPVATGPVMDAATVPAVWAPHRFRAPEKDGALLLEWIGGGTLESHRAAASLAASSLDVQGRPLSRVRAWARQACLQAAAEYTSQLTGAPVAGPPPDAPLFVAGHQPQLFHPGVWVKNFVLGGLSDQAGGSGLNLVVDNDTLSTTAIAVPAGTAAAPRVERIEFDEARPPQPWEDAPLLDPVRFDRFGARVCEAMRAWQVTPVVAEMWPEAVAARRAAARLVDCLVRARHLQERRWGLRNLELPVSRLCGLPPFLWFASHLLAHLPRFREVHNDVLWEYRRINGVRSRSHPVPELGERDGWHEAPFWVWRAGDRRRHQVFARQVASEIVLSDGAAEFARLPLAPGREACCAVEVLERLWSAGIRFRTRALTTTLFARICLGDLFVHGIGGAKYDEMTDRIITRFLGLPPPPFLVATATLRLPLKGTPSVATDEVGPLRHAMRDAACNPERHSDQRPPDELISRKQRLIAAQQSSQALRLPRRERRARRTENRERYQQFCDVRIALAPYAEDARARLQAQLAAAEQSAAARSILASREYSACLYPAGLLQELFERARRDAGRL